jgi:hypothetical protein
MEKQHASKCKTHDKNMVLGNWVTGECDCDGYHTFDELYDHRHTLFIALCRILVEAELYYNDSDTFIRVWRSKLHHDESRYDGWFIMGIGKEPGRQISYHLPLSRWDETAFAETLVNAPEWDGHTSDDVIERLKVL